MSSQVDGAWRQESQEWVETYATPEQTRRRKEQMLRKLRKLGVETAPRDACVYDLCCGMGEALATLYELGFRNLHGLDVTPYPNLEAERRFTFVQADVRRLPMADASVDWLLNIHALHHLETVDNVRLFLDECCRVLKPGGRLGIIDFPGSPQIHIAFRLFLVRPLLVTPYLRWFGDIIRSEWHFLTGYLRQWPRTRRLLLAGRFQVLAHRQEFFYYYLTLTKPERS